MSGKTAGQLAYEAWRGDDDASGLMPPWHGLYDGDKARWERIAPAVETEQLRLAREDRDQLRKRMLGLAAELEDEHLGPLARRIRHAAEPPS